MRKFKSTKNEPSLESDSKPDSVVEERTARQGEDRTAENATEVNSSNSSERCPLSNTAPSKVQLETKVGIDYLAFWVFGKWCCDSKVFFDRLDKAKEGAADDGGNAFISDDLAFSIGRSGSSGRGTHRCRWQLHHNAIYFGICNNPDSQEDRPIAKVEIKGETLTQLGVQGSLEIVDMALESLGIGYGKSKISRLDIKADQFGIPITTYVDDIEDKRAITRARQLNVFGTFEDRQTISIGNRKANRVMCRIYDKLAEISNNPKKAAIFFQCITKGEFPESCTRVEFEIRREGFKELGIVSFEDCFGRLHEIVGYLTHGFLRIADQKVDRNHTDRAKTAKHWLDVSDSLADYARIFRSLPARVPERIPFDSTRHTNQMIGHLVSWLIKDGMRPTTAREIYLFAEQKFLAGLLTAEVFDRYEKALLKFKHKNGNELAAFFDNKSVPVKQALTGVEKVLDADGASPVIQKPKNLFEKEETVWIPNQKRAA